MNNLLLLPVLTVFFLFLVPLGFSQDPDLNAASEGDPLAYRTDTISNTISPSRPVKNILKTDLLSWFFKVGVLKYERVLSENISVQLGFYYSWDFPAYDEGYAAEGYSITPEIRYFLSKNRPAPWGPYIAPNYRYQKLATENHWDSSEATVITNGIAIHFGFQLVLKNLYLVDAWGGLAYNFRNIIEETVPGENIGFPSERGFGGRFGIAIGLGF